jgi:hypothetical protein
MIAINRDLKQLLSRRAQPALSDAHVALMPDHPHRLSLRKLPARQRPRAATRVRLSHAADWSGALTAAVVNA